MSNFLFGRKYSMYISTAFCLGYFPYAPGTVASFVVFGIMALVPIHWYWYLGIFIALWFIGHKATYEFIHTNTNKDPKEVVIDEVLGQLLAGMFVAHNFWLLFLSFIAFRLLDIFKPWPIHTFERLPHAYGVIADDLAAGGIVAFACGLIALYLA